MLQIKQWAFLLYFKMGFSEFLPPAAGKLGKLKKLNFSPNNQTSIKSILSSESFYAGLFSSMMNIYIPKSYTNSSW